MGRIKRGLYKLRGAFLGGSTIMRFIRITPTYRRWFMLEKWVIHEWFYYWLGYEHVIDIVLVLLFVIALYCEPKRGK